MKLSIKTLLAFILILLVSFLVVSCKGDGADDGNGSENVKDENGNTPLPDVEMIKDGRCDYVIVNSSDCNKVAYNLSSELYSRLGIDLPYSSDRSSAPSDKEILIGKTNRQLSVDLAAAIEAYPEDSLAWGFAFKDGKLAMIANSETALKMMLDEFIKLYVDVDNPLVFKAELWSVKEITAEEYRQMIEDEENRKKEEAERHRAERLAFLKDAISSEFKNSDFGPYITNMTTLTGKTYTNIPTEPKSNEHPRVLVNAEMVLKIRADMENRSSRAEMALWNFADVEIKNDAKLPAAGTASRGVHNFDLQILTAIQAKAFAYLITEDEYYAYEAVYAMKNYLKTLDVHYITSDGTREFGFCMYITACVYDWCYDILSADDKFQLAAGVEHILCRGTTSEPDKGSFGGVKMEMGFPPTAQGPVSGHGSERQLLRDYLSMAIAVYDEEPSWWNYVGGRFYDQFVPVREIYYESGMVPQGVSEYAAGRFMSDLYSAMLIKAISGENPFGDGMGRVAVSMASYETYNGVIFSSGDHRLGKNGLYNTVGYCALMTAYLYDDPTAMAIAALRGSGYSSFTSGTYDISAVEWLICAQNGIKPADSKYDGMDTIVYNGGMLGQIISRTAWNNANEVAVLMKIGERTTANHDHQASGIFQIYYKGLLTGDTGVYDSYGTAHHSYFHQATIAHNGLLIYNPALASTNSGYYSGGQRKLPETKSYEGWMSKSYDTGKVLGVSYGYAQNGGAKYAYLSGDITAAYDEITVDYVGRTMLTVYTENEKFPMVMFVLDRIDSTDPSFKKTFLIQIPGEAAPTVDGKTVTVINGNGKLVLNSLLGADTVTPLGGNGNNYLVNGVQLSSKNDATSWGRVEISPSLGNSSDVLLNVMYVTDKNESSILTPTLLNVSEDNIVGSQLLDNVAVFGTETYPITKSITFSTSGEGELSYYVGNIASGTWAVSVNGIDRGTICVTEGEQMVTFKAAAGNITLTPGGDVVGENKAKIKYVLLNGALPDGAPEYYTMGEALTLPVDVTRGGDMFLGWYLDSEYKTPISEIPPTAEGIVTVYAKWSSIYADEDYSSTVLEDVGSSTVNKVTYSGGLFNSVKNGNDGYLVWTTTDQGPSIFLRNTASNYSNMTTPDESVTFEMEISLNGDDAPMNCVLRARDGANAKGNELKFVSINSGSVKCGSKVLFNLTKEMQTLRFVIDFKYGMLHFYDDEGNTIYDTAFSVPESVGTASKWKELFTYELLSWRAEGAGAVRIGRISLYEGNLYETYTTPSENRIVYPDGVVVPKDSPVEYTPGVTVALPASATRDGYLFNGWYADEGLTESITAVPNSAEGSFYVYAKWLKVVVNANYKDVAFEQVDGANPSIGTGITLTGTNTVLSDTEAGMMTWTTTGTGSTIQVNSKSIPTFSENSISYEISLAKAANTTVAKINFRVRQGDNTEYKFATISGGNLSAAGATIFTLTEELQTLRLVLDFENQKIIAYDADGGEMSTEDFTRPEAYATAEAWRAAFTKETLNVRIQTAGTVVIGHILIAEGNIYA